MFEELLTKMMPNFFLQRLGKKSAKEDWKKYYEAEAQLQKLRISPTRDLEEVKALNAELVKLKGRALATEQSGLLFKARYMAIEIPEERLYPTGNWLAGRPVKPEHEIWLRTQIQKESQVRTEYYAKVFLPLGSIVISTAALILTVLAPKHGSTADSHRATTVVVTQPAAVVPGTKPSADSSGIVVKHPADPSSSRR